MAAPSAPKIVIVSVVGALDDVRLHVRRGDSFSIEVDASLNDDAGVAAPLDLTGAVVTLEAKLPGDPVVAFSKTGELDADPTTGVATFPFKSVDTDSKLAGVFPFSARAVWPAVVADPDANPPVLGVDEVRFTIAAGTIELRSVP